MAVRVIHTDVTPDCLVFDTGPLSVFATEEWLGALKAVVGERRAMIPDVVVAELEVGARSDERIRAVLEAPWIEKRNLTSERELELYARFAAFLVKGKKNRGEAGALALASAVGGYAIVDDGVARKLAATHGVKTMPTLALLCEAVRLEWLTAKLVSALVDDFLAAKYRFPFEPGGFEQWARDNSLLP